MNSQCRLLLIEVTKSANPFETCIADQRHGRSGPWAGEMQ